MIQELQERIRNDSEVDENGCWIWKRSKSKRGYGWSYIGSRLGGTRRTVQAHRLSYMAFKGDIPVDLVIDHLCRVHACVNPEHLEAVTQLENVRRGELASLHRDRTHCPRGHEYSDSNTRRYTYGRHTQRKCITCALENARQQYWGRKLTMEACA